MEWSGGGKQRQQLAPAQGRLVPRSVSWLFIQVLHTTLVFSSRRGEKAAAWAPGSPRTAAIPILSELLPESFRLGVVEMEVRMWPTDREKNVFLRAPGKDVSGKTLNKNDPQTPETTVFLPPSRSQLPVFILTPLGRSAFVTQKWKCWHIQVSADETPQFCWEKPVVVLSLVLDPGCSCIFS